MQVRNSDRVTDQSVLTDNYPPSTGSYCAELINGPILVTPPSYLNDLPAFDEMPNPETLGDCL